MSTKLRAWHRQAKALWDHLALLGGRRLDVAYAGLVHQLGLSPGFFKEGWGDLAAIDFQDVQLFSQTWPPQHFDIIQVTVLPCGLVAPLGPRTACLRHVRGPQPHAAMLQPEWKVKWRSKKWNVECELLEASFK